MKNPQDLSREELVEIVTEGIRILYGARQEDGSWLYSSDKEWSGADVCQDFASLLERFGLIPNI